MGKIENVKTYTGKDLETIFFRPMLTGPGAEDLGIRVLYNMPVPTTLHFWKRSGDILQKYVTGGWKGIDASQKFQKTIQLNKVKAEMGYSADDYFSLVYEQITGRADVNMDDLGGTELEEAETALFKESVAESIRVTMWLGDVNRTGGDGKYNSFDGFVKRFVNDTQGSGEKLKSITYDAGEDTNVMLDSVWEQAPEELKSAKSQGELAWFVTSDVYRGYEDYLNDSGHESAFLAMQEGRKELYYKGIPLVDVKLGSYLEQLTDMPSSFILLTDRRNLALAVNTSDFPGTEVRMWYNPDLMENRQRAVFMAGADYLLPELTAFGIGM